MKLAKKLFRSMVAHVPPRLSEQLVAVLEQNAGIGTGADPSKSGEYTALDLVRRMETHPLVIVDVGANQGQYASAVKSVLDGEDFECHSFEPSGTTFAIFSSEHGEDRRVHANNCALGESPGTATLFMDQEASGLASLTKRDIRHHGIDHSAIQETVKVTTLSDYCDEKEIGSVHLLKIDVEGHEMSVLNGGASMFDEERVGLTQFEFGGANIDTRTFFRDFYQFFEERNMSLFRVIGNGRLLHLARYTESCERFRCSNVLAVSDSYRDLVSKYCRVV